MTVIVAVIVGFLAGRMLWLALRKTWQRQVFIRKNFQGTSLCTAAGIVLPLALVMVEAIRAIIGGFGIGDQPNINASRAATLIAVAGFALLGLLDDLTGGAEARGLGGHIRALLRGQLTSGGVKMIGGIALSLVASAFLIGNGGGAQLIIDAAIIALAANFINLLDLRPGRATKTAIIGFIAIAAVSLLDAKLVPAAIVVGAAGALILDDLRERLMLGDTGANALGAAIGVGIVTQVGGTGRIIAVALLLVLNIASEFVSFSKVIDSVPPLHAFDMMGRRSSQSVDVRDEPGGEELPPRPAQPSSRVNVGGAPEARQSNDRVGASSRPSEVPGRQARPFNKDEARLFNKEEPTSERPFTRNHAPGNTEFDAPFGTGAPETDRWQ